MNTQSLDDLLALAAEQKAALEAENEQLRAELAAVTTWASRAYTLVLVRASAAEGNELMLVKQLQANAPAVVRQPGEGEG